VLLNCFCHLEVTVMYASQLGLLTIWSLRVGSKCSIFHFWSRQMILGEYIFTLFTLIHIAGFIV